MSRSALRHVDWNNPLHFVSVCWPERSLYDKQREVLISVRDNVETFVHAANETGKSFVAAATAIWFICSRDPSITILSSSTQAQLESVLWSEIRRLVISSKIKLPLDVQHLKINKLNRRGERIPRNFILGAVTSTVEAFHGYHLENDKARVLWICDEASSCRDEFNEAADSWMHRKLCIGNPLSTENFFYRKCKAGDAPDPAGVARLYRKVIHISGDDSPNVVAGRRWAADTDPHKPPRPSAPIPGLLSYDEYIRRQQEWDEIQQQMRLFGMFYEGGEAFMYPAAWLMNSERLHKQLLEQEVERKVQALGIDVAAGGGDETVWTLADQHGIIEQVGMYLSDTMEIAGRTVRYIRQHKLAGKQVAIDAGGGGKQISDRIRELGFAIHALYFGESPDDKLAYCNRRSELYGILRKRMNPSGDDGGWSIPTLCHQLRQQLAPIPVRYDSEGRLKLIPKEKNTPNSTEVTMRQLLGRSPDHADSAALAAWVIEKHSRRFGRLDPGKLIGNSKFDAELQEKINLFAGIN